MANGAAARALAGNHDAIAAHPDRFAALAALLLPPTLVTGIFGMNTKGLPLTENESGFLWAALLLVLSSVAAFLIMKRIGLIGKF